jgi:hypothetical protein
MTPEQHLTIPPVRRASLELRADAKKALADRIALWLPVIEEDAWKYARQDNAHNKYLSEKVAQAVAYVHTL